MLNFQTIKGMTSELNLSVTLIELACRGLGNWFAPVTELMCTILTSAGNLSPAWKVNVLKFALLLDQVCMQLIIKILKFLK